jgi:hypothetical protein
MMQQSLIPCASASGTRLDTKAVLRRESCPTCRLSHQLAVAPDEAIHLRTGEHIRKGDRIGITEPAKRNSWHRRGGDPMDWYAKQFPGGGIMINATGRQRVFADDIDEKLEFAREATNPATAIGRAA